MRKVDNREKEIKQQRRKWWSLTSLPVDRLMATDCNPTARANKTYVFFTLTVFIESFPHMMRIIQADSYLYWAAQQNNLNNMLLMIIGALKLYSTTSAFPLVGQLSSAWAGAWAELGNEADTVCSAKLELLRSNLIKTWFRLTQK